jgi:hypothetical protein
VHISYNSSHGLAVHFLHSTVYKHIYAKMAISGVLTKKEGHTQSLVNFTISPIEMGYTLGYNDFNNFDGCLIEF